MIGGIDKINGPYNGIVELFIVLNSDWESDPFLVKQMRSKVLFYQEVLCSAEFHEQFDNCRSVIVLETTYCPPEEVQRILAKEGVEVRIVSRPAEEVISSSLSEHDFATIPEPESEPPQPLENSWPQAQADVTSGTAELSWPLEHQRSVLVESGEGQAGSYSGKSLDNSSVISGQDNQVYEPNRASSAMHNPQARAIESKESWEDEDDIDLPANRTGIPHSLIFYVSAAVICVLVAIYALFGLLSPAPEIAPSHLRAEEISANKLPNNLMATVSVRPDRKFFALIPIHNSLNKDDFVYHLLFGVHDTRRLLVFAQLHQSQVFVRMNHKPDQYNPIQKIDVPEWSEDLESATPRPRSYTGRLEHLQRYNNGPLELELPGGNRDVNKLFHPSLGQFPEDSMILIVGANPLHSSGHSGIMLILSMLGLIIFGSISLAIHKRTRRSF